MFKGVRSDTKILLASVTITVIGILLPWIAVHEAPLRGIHFTYGVHVLILLIMSLMVVHISRKMLASILIIIINFLSFIVVVQSYIDLFGSPQSPSFFDLGIGVFITGIGVIGMIISGIYGITNHRKHRGE